MITKRGVQALSKVLGKVVVPFAESINCPNCGSVFLSTEESSKVDAYVKNLERIAIRQLPVEDFITLNEAATLLNVNKQAVQQNKRIQRGFVYSVTKGRSPLFHKHSLEIFRETGDGRFNLTNYQENVSTYGAVSAKSFRTNMPRVPEHLAEKSWKEFVEKAKQPHLTSIVD